MQSLIAPKPSQLFGPPCSPETVKRSEAGGVSRADATATALYIHWPYCESKCPYCDFNSYARRSISEEEFVGAAIHEIAFYGALVPGRRLSSIFFGGGTPSLMAPRSVAALIDAAARIWAPDDACEITLEANPSSVEAARFAGYRAAGVNRVSLGVQSFSDEELRFLGRLHTAAEARQAIAIAAHHFERISFDLIYARPGQRADTWSAELREALALAQGHLSLYQLTIEPETAFFNLHRRGKLNVPDADLAADLYELTQEICEAAGLPAYEISNHAHIGEECRHNLTYWRYGDYVGIGPGAHGRITIESEKHATQTVKAPAQWHDLVRQHGHGGIRQSALTAREEAEEMVLMGLRLREGLDAERLEARTGHRLADSDFAVLEAEGLLQWSGAHVRTTPAGRLVLNAIVETLVAGLRPPPTPNFAPSSC